MSKKTSAPSAPDLECPEALPPLAQEEWRRITGELTALGLLSKFDRGPLSVYCQAFAMWSEAVKALQETGVTIASPNGYPVQSPHVSIINKQAEIMLRIAAEFGFSPGARARHMPPSKRNAMLMEPDDGLNF